MEILTFLTDASISIPIFKIFSVRDLGFGKKSIDLPGRKILYGLLYVEVKANLVKDYDNILISSTWALPLELSKYTVE